MNKKYIIAIDQSTSGTKAVLCDENGLVVGRSDLPHEQIISKEGYVSHNPMEVYQNAIQTFKNVVAETKIDKNDIVAMGITNQRETTLLWDRETGLPIDNAAVWQCARGTAICDALMDNKDMVYNKTGLKLSTYFSASKVAWLLRNNNIEGKKVCSGTIDSWLVFKLTNGKSFKTDYSNASRTQLFNIIDLKWDKEICDMFEIPMDILPEVCDSNSLFGMTDIDGFLDKEIPIYGVLGDSHGAMFAQGCTKVGMAKATYGTGSSIMANIGNKPILLNNGVVTSIGWAMNGKIDYVFEGNINYTGSVIKWLVDDVKLINSSKEAGALAKEANENDTTYLVPAFTGLGAPYWNSDVNAMIFGMSRNTGKAEIVRAAEECIAYQVADIIKAMGDNEDDISINELRVDGGPTRDEFLMQFQSDILNLKITAPDKEELSAIGVAYCAGLAVGLYGDEIYSNFTRRDFTPKMDEKQRDKKWSGWKNAVNTLIKK